MGASPENYRLKKSPKEGTEIFSQIPEFTKKIKRNFRIVNLKRIVDFYGIIKGN